MPDTQSAERIAYRAALAAQDWEEAARLVRLHPEIFGTPPEDVPDEIAAITNEPTDVGWMMVEWSIQQNACVPGISSCKPYTLRAIQFDHLSATATQAEADTWLANYVANRQAHAPAKNQLGETLFLCKVDQIIQITDFTGVPYG